MENNMIFRYFQILIASIFLILLCNSLIFAQTCITPPPPTDANWFGLKANPGGPLASSGALVSDYSATGNIYIGGTVESDIKIAKWDGSNWEVLGLRLYNDDFSPAEIHSLEVDTNGDVYVGGAFDRAQDDVGVTPVITTNIARWNAAAEVWEAVGLGTNFTVYSIAIDGDKIYAGGANGNGINPNGTPIPLNRIGYWDNSINQWQPVGLGVDQGEVKLIGIDNASDLFVCGSFSNGINPGGGQITAERIAKWDGSSWSALGEGLTGINSYRGGIVFDNNNELIIGTDFTNAVNTGGGTEPGPVARWDGTQWTSLSAALPGFVFDLDRDGFGNIFFLYLNSNFDASHIDKYDGVGWISFTVFTGKYVQTISGEPAAFSQRLYAGGLFNSLFYVITGNTLNITNNAMFDGLNWREIVGAGGSDGVIKTLETLQCGNGSCLVYAGGSFTNISGVAANNIASFDGTNWSEVGKGVNGPVHDIDRNKNPVVSRIVVGGNFTEAIQQDGSVLIVNNVAVYTGSWSALGKGVNGPVNAVLSKLSFFNGTVRGSIIVAGNFTQATNPDNSIVQVNSIARWDWQLQQWFSLGEGVTGGTKEILAITEGSSIAWVDITEPNFYIGGSFTGAINDGGIVVNSNNIIYYNSDIDSWEAVGQGVDDIVRALALGPFVPQIPVAEQTRIIVGGNHQQSINSNGTTVTTPYISLWDQFNQVWIPIRGGLDGVVYTIDNEGIIGGEFTKGIYEIGSSRQMNHIGKVDLLDPQTWIPLGLSGIDNVVNAAISVGWCRASGENIFAGGDFTSAGFRIAKNLARWIYRYQSCNNVINLISVGGGGGGGSGAIGVVMFGSSCTNLMSNPFFVDETLFDSLAFRETIALDSLFTRQYFDLTIYPTGDPNNPIKQIDSLYDESDGPGTYIFVGVDDTTLYAPNPDGISIAANVLLSSYDYRNVQSGNVELLFTNAVTDAPAIDIFIQGGGNLVSGLPFNASSPQVSLNPANYTFEVKQTSNGQLIGTYDADLTNNAEEFVTLLLSGFVDPSSNQNGPPMSLDKYESGTGTIIVGVNEQNIDPTIPLEFSLKQNYPNPFNPSTKLSFTVDVTQQTELSVYNILGQRVTTLFNDVAIAGKSYEVNFNAGRFASGIYLGVLKSKQKRQAIKMLLIK